MVREELLAYKRGDILVTVHDTAKRRYGSLYTIEYCFEDVLTGEYIYSLRSESGHVLKLKHSYINGTKELTSFSSARGIQLVIKNELTEEEQFLGELCGWNREAMGLCE